MVDLLLQWTRYCVIERVQLCIENLIVIQPTGNPC